MGLFICQKPDWYSDISQTKTSYCSDSFFSINVKKKEVPDFCYFSTIVIHFIPLEEGHKKLPRLAPHQKPWDRWPVYFSLSDGWFLDSGLISECCMCRRFSRESLQSVINWVLHSVWGDDVIFVDLPFLACQSWDSDTRPRGVKSVVIWCDEKCCVVNSKLPLFHERAASQCPIDFLVLWRWCNLPIKVATSPDARDGQSVRGGSGGCQCYRPLETSDPVFCAQRVGSKLQIKYINIH